MFVVYCSRVSVVLFCRVVSIFRAVAVVQASAGVSVRVSVRFPLRLLIKVPTRMSLKGFFEGVHKGFFWGLTGPLSCCYIQRYMNRR